MHRLVIVEARPNPEDDELIQLHLECSSGLYIEVMNGGQHCFVCGVVIGNESNTLVYIVLIILYDDDVL